MSGGKDDQANNMNSKAYHYLKLVFSSYSKAPYYLYLKKHEVNGLKGSKLVAKGRTIFVSNIPGFLGEVEIKYIFSMVNHVEKVTLWKNKEELEMIEKDDVLIKLFPTQGHKNAYVIFDHETAIHKLWKWISTVGTLDTSKIPGFKLELGVKKWRKKYLQSKHNFKHVKGEAIELIKAYDALNATMQEKKVQDDDDDNTWITIHGKKSLPKLPFKNYVNENDDHKPKKKLNDGYFIYSFKRRQIQEERIALLRQKFEEDKRRVSEMRQKRKFNPL